MMSCQSFHGEELQRMHCVVHTAIIWSCTICLEAEPVSEATIWHSWNIVKCSITWVVHTAVIWSCTVCLEAEPVSEATTWHSWHIVKCSITWTLLYLCELKTLFLLLICPLKMSCCFIITHKLNIFCAGIFLTTEFKERSSYSQVKQEIFLNLLPVWWRVWVTLKFNAWWNII